MEYFWLSVGFMAGIAAAFFAVRLWPSRVDDSVLSVRRSRWVMAGAIGGFLLVAVALYLRIGSPQMVDTDRAVATATGNHAPAAGVNGNATGSMEEATAKLASRLAASGGTDADWQLLQQSYAFLGDTEAADLAQQHKLKPANDASLQVTTTTPASATTRAVSEQAALASYQKLVAKTPSDAAAWLVIASLQRAARNFTDANSAYEKVIKLKAMDADAWADYADVSASIAGTLTNSNTRNALNAALKLKPQHSKALWLQASLAHEEHRYAAALKLWQQLRVGVPDSSPDASVIDANIKEAQSLVGVAVPDNASKTMAQVSGSVVLDPALEKRVTADMTLFVYAKAPDSPAPVAAYRTSVKSWPVKFVLDDTLAMMSTRKLSQFDTITVSARLSRSGQALAQTGDLQTDTVSVSTRSSQNVALHISRLVP